MKNIKTKYVGYLLSLRKENKNFYFAFFLTKENLFLKVKIHWRDLPIQMKNGDKWIFFMRMNNWIWGKCQTKSKIKNHKNFDIIENFILQICNLLPKNNWSYSLYEKGQEMYNNYINSKIWLIKMLLKIIEKMGQKLNFEKCGNCGKTQIQIVNFDCGGGLCKNCNYLNNKFWLTKPYWECIQKIDAYSIDKLKTMKMNKKILNFWYWLISDFIDFRCGFYFKIQGNKKFSKNYKIW